LPGDCIYANICANRERAIIYAFLENAEFLEARRNKRYFLFRGVLPNTPSWDDVFRDLEKSLEERSLIKAGPYFSFVTHNGDKHIPLAAQFLDEVKKLDASLSGSAHVYLGLTRFSESFGKHKDNADVFFWQIIGSTRWKVFTQAGVKEHTLQVGDVLYVPRYMEHDVTSLCPRAGISFGLDYGSAKRAG
jgi:ribosomal protein L16 Arg81 hydroxylase